eukprot:11189396-Lingulodinium_polyedra.AAC.1
MMNYEPKPRPDKYPTTPCQNTPFKQRNILAGVRHAPARQAPLAHHSAPRAHSSHRCDSCWLDRVPTRQAPPARHSTPH